LASIVSLALLADAVVWADVTPRIVGGQDIDIAFVPSTVSLLNTRAYEISGNARFAHFCGATVIDKRWVLTAAHCVVSKTDATVKDPEEILVAMGSANLGELQGQPIAAKSVVPHPEFVSSKFGHDLALIELSSDATVTATPLDDAPVLLDQRAFTAGWGALNEGDRDTPQRFPDALQGAGVLLLPYNECDIRYPQHAEQTDMSLRPDQICAAIDGGGIDSCQGDSGGPLYRLSEDGSRVVSLLGVVSFGVGCGRAEFPGIYAGVGTALDFIRRTIDSAPGVQPNENNDGPIEGGGKDIPDRSPARVGGCSLGVDDTNQDPLFLTMIFAAICFVKRRAR